MTLLALAHVEGIPGPKGSLNGFCPTCAKRGLPQRVVMKEQSEVGVRFRKVVARWLNRAAAPERIAYCGPVETRLIFFIPRQMAVKNGVEQGSSVPSHDIPMPTHRNSGDVEKHVRTVHDALMDANVIKDDSQVWRIVAEKRWADAENPPGVVIEVKTS